MQQRVNIQNTEPRAIESIFVLEDYINNCGLSNSLIHLIKLRASQINGCTFCIKMHTKAALEDGETSDRLSLLNIWKESNVFTPAEKAVLQITEEVTLIHKKGVSDETYSVLRAHFNGNQIAQIITTISTINVWNRVAISTKM